jgi:hypothetical protein
MVDEGWSVLRFWNVDALKELDAVVDTILAALDRRLDAVVAPDLRFIPAANNRDHRLRLSAAPHPYPLPVKNGERGTFSPSLTRHLFCQEARLECARLTLANPSPRPEPVEGSRGEGKGEGQI